jgi:hypothetical protein
MQAAVPVTFARPELWERRAGDACAPLAPIPAAPAGEDSCSLWRRRARGAPRRAAHAQHAAGLLERLLTPRRARRSAVGRVRVLREGTEHRLGRVAGGGAPYSRRAGARWRRDPVYVLDAPRPRRGPERGGVAQRNALMPFENGAVSLRKGPAERGPAAASRSHGHATCGGGDEGAARWNLTLASRVAGLGGRPQEPHLRRH